MSTIPTQRQTEAVGVPCAARPSTEFRHFDGPCRCFCGGPSPEFPPSMRTVPRQSGPRDGD